jgi:hypothetical protein
MKDVKKRHLEETAAKKLEEKRLKEEAEQIKAEYEKWKVNWRDDLKLDEGMTTSGLYKVNLPSTGSDILQDIPYGLTGTGEINYGSLLSNSEEDPNTLVNPNDEYTALTNMSGMYDAPDPNGVGQMPRTFDIETQKFNGYVNNGGSFAFNDIVPGYKIDSHRYVTLSGVHRNGAVDDDPPGGYYPDVTNRGTVRLHFGGVGSPRFMAMKPVDTREVDTLRVTASRGEFSIRTKAVGGWSVDPRPMIYYWAGNHPDYQPTPHKTGGRASDNKVYSRSNQNGPNSEGSNQHRGRQEYRDCDGWRPIHMKPDGTLDNSVNPYIIDYERAGDNAVRLPDWARGENARYMIFQNHSGATTYSAWTLRDIQFQRKGNMTAFRRLDDPQASAFIRVGQGAGNLSAKQRRKRVRDMINASLKYGKTKFGDGVVTSTNID